MRRYAIMFLLLALVALALGAWALAGTLAFIARALVLVFLVLFVASLWGRRSIPRE